MTTKEAIKEIETYRHFAATGSIRAEAEQVMLAEIDALRGALKPFVDVDPYYLRKGILDIDTLTLGFTAGEFRRAREVFERTK